MFFHTLDVYNRKYSYIEEISREICRRMYNYGTYQLGNTHITGLKSNQTTTRPITLTGSADSDGSCIGGAYSDSYGTWMDVIILASVNITLHDYFADVCININHVHTSAEMVSRYHSCRYVYNLDVL